MGSDPTTSLECSGSACYHLSPIFRSLCVRPHIHFSSLRPWFWAGNFVLARAVHSAVPTVGLAFWRWVVVAAFVVSPARAGLHAQWPQIRTHAGLVIVLGALSVGAFNTFVDIGVQTTSAAGALMLISAVPVFILVLAPMLLGNPLAGREMAGVAVSGLGVLTVLSHRNPLSLEALFRSRGNLWVLAGVFSWALSSVLLRRFPAGIGGLALFAATVLVDLVFLLPFSLFETLVQNRPVILTRTRVESVAYVAVFALVLAYLFWNKAVALIGAERAGIFIHLMPAFGRLSSALWLKERVTRSGSARPGARLSGACAQRFPG